MIHDYISLVQHLQTSLTTAYTMQVNKPRVSQNFFEIDHTFLQVTSGQVTYETTGKKSVLRPGQVLFIPGGEPIVLIYQEFHKTANTHYSYTDFSENSMQALPSKPYAAELDQPIRFACIHFRTQFLQSFDLLPLLKLSPTLLPYNHQIATGLQNILHEQATLDAATKRATNLYTELLVIALLRYFNTQPWMLEKLLEQQHYFQEERLLKILQYIHSHLPADLSNNQLAAIANISEDYIGQYFKKLTGISLQTYIENQRLEEAMRLLKNTNQRIYKIGHQVGFIDSAYFCRRFKLKFKVPATKIRHGHVSNSAPWQS
jgi:AraC-like DNA-binding protein